jgi:hypothetical protein
VARFGKRGKDGKAISERQNKKGLNTPRRYWAKPSNTENLCTSRKKKFKFAEIDEKFRDKLLSAIWSLAKRHKKVDN